MAKKTKKKVPDGTHTAKVTTRTKHHKHGTTMMQVADIGGAEFFRIVSNKKK